MTGPGLQNQCELGQRQLMAMDYLTAEATLADAAERAWAERDFDTLSRVCLPLQEARRQRRQRAGEGIVCLDLLAKGIDDQPDARRVIEEIPHGQLLIAGWGNVKPAVELRRLQAERKLFVETFLAAVYPNGAVVIAPFSDAVLPPAVPQPLDDFSASLPPHCVVLWKSDLPRGRHSPTANSYGQVMDLWERLHAPFLAAADAETDPILKIQAYRRTIEVDYACELAHQRMAETAQKLARSLLK